MTWNWKSIAVAIMVVIVVVFFWDIACEAVGSAAGKAKGAL